MLKKNVLMIGLYALLLSGSAYAGSLNDTQVEKSDTEKACCSRLTSMGGSISAPNSAGSTWNSNNSQKVGTIAMPAAATPAAAAAAPTPAATPTPSYSMGYMLFTKDSISKTFVVPSGIYSLKVGAIGGGGGQTSWNTPVSLSRGGSLGLCGGGGGSGYYKEATIAVTPGQSIPITVGSAGTAMTITYLINGLLSKINPEVLSGASGVPGVMASGGGNGNMTVVTTSTGNVGPGGIGLKNGAPGKKQTSPLSSIDVPGGAGFSPTGAIVGAFNTNVLAGYGMGLSCRKGLVADYSVTEKNHGAVLIAW